MNTLHPSPQADPPASSVSSILAEAALNAAGLLQIKGGELARIIGVSPAMVSKMGRANAPLPQDAKVEELTKCFLRVFRSLDAIVGGDDGVAAQWLRNENSALRGTPLALMQTVPGLVQVMEYLDQRRAPL